MNENGEKDLKETVDKLIKELVKAGRDPVMQLSGYAVTGDPTYFPAGEARSIGRKIDRDDLLVLLIETYLKKAPENGEEGER